MASARSKARCTRPAVPPTTRGRAGSLPLELTHDPSPSLPSRNALDRRSERRIGCVLASLLVWYQTLGSISVSTVREPKAELFYWVTITFSQTLGTALGD